MPDLELTPLQQAIVRAMTEAELQEAIIEYAESRGWQVYHARDSRRQKLSHLPDLLLIRPPRMLWRELKRERRHPTAGQIQTMLDLEACGQNVGVWRPRDWVSGCIEEMLK